MALKLNEQSKENQELEFKSSLAEINEILETISAFANKKGGRILVGIEENKDGSVKEIIGLEVKGRVIENLTNEIKQNTDPVIFPSIEIKKIEGKEVLSIEIEESPHKPVFAKGKAYKRVGRSNLRLTAEEIRNMAKVSVNYSFTELICKEAKWGDIDEEKVKWFVKEARKQRNLDLEEGSPLKEVLMRLKLLNDDKLTNAAVLLFGKNPQKFFLQAITKAIRFKGNDTTEEMIDFKTIEGDILTQLKKAEDFIFEHIPKTAWIEEGKLQRQEKWLYPERAIREALANTFAHRDYDTTSAVQVRIFDDRLEIWNPGSLPNQLTVESLKKKHDSIPKNPLIARAFFWIKFVEEVGTGTNKIIKWCKSWDLPEPKFEETESSFVLTFRKYAVTEEIMKELPERQRKAVEYLLKYKNITNQKYRELNPGISDRTALNDLNDLIKKGILKAGGEKKYRSYALR